MPVEIEVPTEHLHEVIHEAHHAEAHGAGHGGGRFTLAVALSSALLAVLAATAALFAGHAANEALLERIEAGDQWAYFQAKGIKANVLQTKIDTLAALGKPTDPRDASAVERYKAEQGKIEAHANAFTAESRAHLDQHNTLAGSVTFFQIAIALGAIAVLTKRKQLWWLSLAVGVAGGLFLARGLLPHAPAGEAPESTPTGHV